MPEQYKHKEMASRTKLGRFAASIEQITDKSGRWLILSLVLLATVVLASFSMYSYKKGKVAEKDKLVSQIERLNSERDRDLESNFSALKGEIENFKKVLENHIYPSLTFRLLEELVVPGAWFTTYSADFSAVTLSFGVQAIDYMTLAKQITVFEKDERVKSIEFSAVSLSGTGGVATNLTFVLDPEVLKSKSE